MQFIFLEDIIAEFSFRISCFTALIVGIIKYFVISFMSSLFKNLANRISKLACFFITLPSGRNLVYVKPRAMRRSLRREISMHLNIRTDKAIKDQAEEIFNELGLNMTTAVNMFLRTAIREHGIPFELKLEVPNDTTAAAIEEGRKMMKDPSAPRYSSMDALKAALDV